MKHIAGLLAGALLATMIAACTPEGSDETAVATAAETADEFVARANKELKDLSAELGAASWVRATYITDDTTIIASAAMEK